MVRFIKGKNVYKAIILYILILAAYPAFADTFVETFGSNTYKDTTNTTANWNTIDGRLMLPRQDKFSETTGVINWGGGILSIDYDTVSGKWLIGGYNGKLNEYDGTHFINRSTSLTSGWGTGFIYSVRSNGSYWLIGGSAHKLNKWDGANTWTDLSAQMSGSWDIRAIGARTGGTPYWLVGGTGGNLYRFEGTNPSTGSSISAGLSTCWGGAYDVLTISYSTRGVYWLIGGKNGKLAKYDGSSFTDLSSSLGFGTNDVNAIDWRDTGSGDGIFLIGGGSEKLSTYSNSAFTDHSADAGLDFSTIWSVKWNGSYWLIGGSQGSVTRITAYNGGTSYYQYGSLSYFNTDPVWAIGSNGGGDSGVNLMGGRNSKLVRSIGSWNSPSNTDYTAMVRDFGEFQIKFAEYNGTYWLIGGASGSINRYSGTAYTDLRAALEAVDPAWKDNTVQCAAWNPSGSYWLIGGTGGKLAYYDGTTFLSRTAQLNSGTSWGTNAVNFIEYDNSQWLLGGTGKMLATSTDGTSFAALTIPAGDWGNSTDAILCADWAGGAFYSGWMIGGINGRLEYYEPAGAGTWTSLTSSLDSCIGSGYNVNAIKWDEGFNMRIACNGGRLAEYQLGSFTDISGNLQNFGSANIYGLDYKAAASMWMYGGSTGKVNISIISGVETFTDYSYSSSLPPPGMIENFGPNAVNAVTYNGDYWIIAGDNAKLNRYGNDFALQADARSLTVDSWVAGYECATITADQVLNGQQISYYLSANGGATWLTATVGTAVCFAGADNGTALKWAAHLRTFDSLIPESPYVDSLTITFGKKPGYSPTITPTWTVSNTYTVTPTITQTHTDTYTATASFTVTGTYTATPTATGTVTPTVTGTVTPTATGTVTPTVTGTVTPTATGTVTPTVTRTFTATVTRTVTGTITDTVTGTVTGTVTNTITGTVTGTVTPSVTATVTCTMTPSVTGTVTGTVTRTVTGTITPSITGTVTASVTGTVTRTITLTGTPTATQSATPSVTHTVTGTFTATPTFTPSYTTTATFTITETGTETQFLTPTITMTYTITETWTSSPTATPNATRTFGTGSFIIPMDTTAGRTNQNYGMWRAYGLVYKLLSAGIPVNWAIKSYKTYGEVDFTCSQVCDVRTGTINTYANPSYAGGPFIIDASNSVAARAIFDAWNLGQTTYRVTMHQFTGTGTFDAPVFRRMRAAPGIALLNTPYGNTNPPTGTSYGGAVTYLNSAAIPDSLGNAWSSSSPDLITISQVAGPTASDHHEGALFLSSGGLPKYCTFIVMHWGAYPVGEYGGGAVITDAYAGRDNAVSTTFTVEAKAEMEEYIKYPGSHIYAQCIAVNALENDIISTTPTSQADWIYGGHGHWITTNGFSYTDDNITVTANVLPDSPFGQATGYWTNATGSQTAFNLMPGSVFYGGSSSIIQMNLDPVTGSTHPNMFMTGYYHGLTSSGKISYMCQHTSSNNLPYTGNASAPAMRYFYNSLFESPNTSETVPELYLDKTGPAQAEIGMQVTYNISYQNVSGIAYSVTLMDTVPANAAYVSSTGGGTLSGGVVTWNLGALDIGASGSVSVTYQLGSASGWDNRAYATYKTGPTMFTAYSQNVHTDAVVFTATPTITATVTRTRTVTGTYTITGTVTPTMTRTITATITRTFTGTVTDTITGTVTQTVTRTVTPTVTGTVTHTVTQTVTRTATRTPSWTMTETHSASPTETGTLPPGITLTFTGTVTRTPSVTRTHTFTPTRTRTLTGTPTFSSTATGTPTPSATRTGTASYTVTVTMTLTGTITPTHTVTPTSTRSPVYTHTASPTETPVYSATDSPTSTPVYSATSSATPSMTLTRTPTYTATRTETVYISYTVTPTRTASPVFSWTTTRTVSPTQTITPTITQTPAPVSSFVVYPNPCNRDTAVRGSVKFEVPGTAHIRIYNAETFKVFDRDNVTRLAEWPCTNLKGEKVAPGVYFYVVEMQAETVRGKVFITK